MWPDVADRQSTDLGELVDRPAALLVISIHGVTDVWMEQRRVNTMPMYTHTHIYIYIYIYIEGEREKESESERFRGQ